LLLSIGIPSLLVILSSIQQNARLTRLEANFDKNNESIERKFDGMRSEMVALRDSIHRDMIALHERVAVVEAKHS
jgi:hypothetical protein